MKSILIILMLIALIPSSVLASTEKNLQSIQFPNEYYYDQQGNFLPEKAKDAVIALLEYHNYPIFDGIRSKIFAVDYNTGRFADVGISGIMFENNQTNMYVLLDIFLMPNQMVAEHWHNDGKTSAAKREGWLVRWGYSYIGGIGENNMAKFPQLKIPQVHWQGKVDAEHITSGMTGSFTNMKQVLSKHWMLAGKEGAIITEVANFSDSKTSIRSDPKMN